ncbi:Golgi-associated plant pathogenesis-related protein 1 [Exaiptasia diaphana]|uniref:SCP domain-containing protein n=1 Tax=Exaiptasia diaphana TaxID=2652724 RepID=A0A913X0G9_EXADI|nr:Golgi-associated plant pathogenesis-related protein 1 [Exaiptasia diaphana]
MFLAVLFVIGSFAFLEVTGNYASQTLEAHNRYRRTHEAGPLRLNQAMSSNAAGYARTLARTGRFKHSPKSSRTDRTNGENLVYRCSSYDEPLPAKQAVKQLYDEVCQYNFNRPGFSMATGHFTQLIWKASTELGVGTATKRKGRMNCLYVVFRYKRGGNVPRAYETNAVRGSFRRSYCDTLAKKDEPEQMYDEN